MGRIQCPYCRKRHRVYPDACLTAVNNAHVHFAIAKAITNEIKPGYAESKSLVERMEKYAGTFDDRTADYMNLANSIIGKGK